MIQETTGGMLWISCKAKKSNETAISETYTTHYSRESYSKGQTYCDVKRGEALKHPVTAGGSKGKHSKRKQHEWMLHGLALSLGLGGVTGAVEALEDSR